MGSALRRRLQLLVSGAHEAACGARRYMVARSSLVLSVADEAGEPSEDGREATRPLSLQQSHELLVGAPAVQSPNEGPVAVCCCCAPMLDKQHSSVLLLCYDAWPMPVRIGSDPGCRGVDDRLSGASRAALPNCCIGPFTAPLKPSCRV